MSFKDLAARASGQWDRVIPALAPDTELVAAIERGHRKHGLCPKHGGENGDAFRVLEDFLDTGGACCNTCGVFPTGFALLQWAQDWDWARVARSVEDYLDGTRGKTSIPRKRPTRKARQVDRGPPHSVLTDLWGFACGIRGTGAGPLREYLKGRGLTQLNPLPYVRFHPKLLYVDGKTKSFWPGMLAQIVSPDRRVIGLHRTYLDPWKGRKAPVRAQKKVLRARGETLTGSTIRLYRGGPRLGLTEGIETAVAVNKATGMPVWATTSATLLRSAVLPPGVRHVVIWADRDPRPRPDREPAGREAARAAAARFREEGRTVEIRYPRFGPKSDWNDVLCKQGVDGFPEVHRQAG